MTPGTWLVPGNSDDQPELDQHPTFAANERVVPVNSDAVAPRPSRRPRQLIHEGPDSPSFADLMIEPLRRWAVAVAENFVWLAARPHSEHTVEDCWIDTESALCARYSTVNGNFGVRFANVYVSPLSGEPLNPTGRVARSARWQASNLLDVQLAGGDPDRCDWAEDDGREWCGRQPAAGWPSVIDPASRVVTIRSQGA